MQLILREEQLPTALMKSFVTEVMAVCRDLGIASHADAGKLGRLRPSVTEDSGPASG